jgi:hypothetical protein
LLPCPTAGSGLRFTEVWPGVGHIVPVGQPPLSWGTIRVSPYLLGIHNAYRGKAILTIISFVVRMPVLRSKMGSESVHDLDLPLRSALQTRHFTIGKIQPGCKRANHEFVESIRQLRIVLFHLG